MNHEWKLQSGCVTDAEGSTISSADYHPAGWLDALVPGTVLGSQVAAGIFPDPFFAMNLRKIPGTDYPIPKIFAYLPMSQESPYHCPWWYRTEFTARAAPGRKSLLHFDGINYRANIWLNGKQIASSDNIAGAFRTYDLDVSGVLRPGTRNALAVEVFAQTENDLGIDFLDWNPAPADKSLGLWRGVSLVISGAVSLRDPAVATHFTKIDLSEAELRITADVRNNAEHPVTALVAAQIGASRVEQWVKLSAREARIVHFDADKFAELRLSHPPVWWPYQYGAPHLEHLTMSVAIDGTLSDEQTVAFGIREITSALNERGFLQFQINHRDILIRGGGWAPDLFYREPRERIRQELAYVKDMNLNTIRLEGKLGSEDIFNLADEMGILIMAGWQCCDFWQAWDRWTPEDRSIAVASTYSQVSRLRSHPSLLAWLNGSDEAPPPQVESEFLSLLKERDWPNPVMSAAADRTSSITGKSGVKMTGPYDYVPPEYWYLDKDRFGGAFGFNMETSPGPAIPTAASVRRTLPKESWWPIDRQWNYHAGLGKFAQYTNFTHAMTATYGAADTLDAFTLRAQLMAYDGERALFEAYSGNKYKSTGVIQWMLNNAWPSFIWHLYDYYLVPGGGYFGSKKANEPLHIQYGYDDRRVTVVNSTLAAYKGLHATAKVLSINGGELFRRKSSLDLGADGVARVFSLPEQTGTVFLRLELRNNQGKRVSDNFYWVPAQLAQMNWEKSTYVNTPALTYADMRDLAHLPAVPLQAELCKGTKPASLSIRLKNKGTTVAFFLYLRAVEARTDNDITPIFWSDNFISLLPGETRTLEVTGVPSLNAEIQVAGWNVRALTLHL